MSLVLNGTTGIVSANIQDGTITGSDIAGTTIVAANIANGTITPTQLARPLTLGTSVSVSGTSVDFTGLPNWLNKVTVILNGVSSSGSSLMQVQIGSGSITTTGYNSGAWTSNTANSGLITSGFVLSGVNNTAAIYYGSLFLVRQTNNIWVESHSLGGPVASYQSVGGGSVSLGGILDRLRLTTVNGTDTFDAGTVNIMYE